MFRSHKFPPPGRLIDVGGHRLHIWEQGTGPHTVVFDAALGASCLSWSLVQPEVAKFVRTVSYDRAGLGWSDAGPEPRTALRVVGELHALLVRAQVPPPFILVGHSYGGFSVRLFAAKYPELVSGLVLVDVPDPREWANPSPVNLRRLQIGARLSRRGALAARLGIARLVSWLATSGARGMARIAVSFVDGGTMDRVDQDRILAPMNRVPREFHPALRYLWTQPRFFQALAGQMECLVESAQQVLAAGPMGNIPLVVLTAANAAPARLAQQEETARLSTRGKHLLARHSGHWIALEEPNLVVQAVRDVISME